MLFSLNDKMIRLEELRTIRRMPWINDPELLRRANESLDAEIKVLEETILICLKNIKPVIA